VITQRMLGGKGEGDVGKAQLDCQKKKKKRKKGYNLPQSQLRAFRGSKKGNYPLRIFGTGRKKGGKEREEG